MSFRMNFNDELQSAGKKEPYQSCICSELELVKETQEQIREDFSFSTQDDPNICHDTIPIMLQTASGHPFFTWGEVGTDHCYKTSFFKLISIDWKNQCAKLELLRPLQSDHEENKFYPTKICHITGVLKTRETITVSLVDFAAVKWLKPTLVQE